jgi:hypothetical protein
MLEIAIIIAFVLLLAHVLDDAESEPDPLERAHFSIERLDSEAERAMAELGALDREERS